VALVQEKLRWLRKVVDGVTKRQPSHPEQEPRWRKRGDENNVRVVGFFGGSKIKASWIDMDIAVCTIEKARLWFIEVRTYFLIFRQANSLVNAAIEDLSVGNLGVVVIDELHMVDDSSRGYILELMATKLLSLEQNVQLIGMSATLTVSYSPVLPIYY
jgi:DNA polymerase theta